MPDAAHTPPPLDRAELPLIVLLVMVMPAPSCRCRRRTIRGVARDRAGVDRGRGRVGMDPAAAGKARCVSADGALGNGQAAKIAIDAAAAAR